MPLTVARVREPQGHVAASLFPADDTAALDARLAAYIAEAEARPAVAALAADQRDAAAAAWVYHRAFRAAYAERISSALQRGVDGSGSSSYSNQQIASLADEADRWLAIYSERTGDAAGVSHVPQRSTRSQPINFQW